jgi:hypothetical protein
VARGIENLLGLGLLKRPVNQSHKQPKALDSRTRALLITLHRTNQGLRT